MQSLRFPPRFKEPGRFHIDWLNEGPPGFEAKFIDDEIGKFSHSSICDLCGFLDCG